LFSEEKAFGCDFSFNIQYECVIEWHVMSITAKHYKVLASIKDTRVAITCCRSLSLNLAIAMITSCSVSLIHAMRGCTLKSACCPFFVRRMSVLSLFHRGVILVEALVSILDNKRVHH
jgi:hypothetical protein